MAGQKATDETGLFDDDAPDEDQGLLFGELEDFTRWREEWAGMPEFVQEDQTPWKSVVVHFEKRADMERFGKLVEQKLTFQTRSLWYPEAEIGRMTNKRYADDS